jgi:elongator complex protein 2
VNNTITLASGSQDGYIRLWVIEPKTNTANGIAEQVEDDLLDAFERSLGELGENDEGGRKISNRSHLLVIKDQEK